MNIVEYDQKCKSCRGTGLYVGIGERDGAAVICHTCEGTGCNHVKHEYEDFSGRETPNNVKRVYRANPGICIGENETVNLEDFGGLSLEQWLDGVQFTAGTEDRKHTCPAWFYQSADYKKKPSWDECGWGGTFSSCDHFCNKDKCWKRWDGEYT